MDYLLFSQEKPSLFGQISVNGKSKIGSFLPLWNKYTNSLVYRYHTSNGRKGQGGFTLMKAYHLFKEGRLSTNPADGKAENYI